jgi:2-polyprenyl-3-methyl-5-hydroxy-6-metoxy-1,4-benzoquinol methylase
MATVFMKWLETSPKDYDRGIQLLTLGKLKSLKQKIAREYIQTGTRVLEIGCGTGTLTQLMAQHGAVVTGIDASPAMLAEAEQKIEGSPYQEQVTLKFLDATQIGDHFPPESFDLIISTLVFSEFSREEQRYVLETCIQLMAPGGRLLIADEVVPSRFLSRLLFSLVRFPLVLLTWLLTRTTTSALRDFETLLAQSGFRLSEQSTYLGGSLVLYEALISTESPTTSGLPSTVIGHLKHQVTPRTVLLDIYSMLNRMIPPYPKVRTGLYALGEPTPASPVLVTGNYDLTVRRLVKAIDGQADAWILVADSAGINVWCGAGGGFFTAEKVIAALKTSRLEEVVDHHALILPQLCANGVDGWRIRQETGWGVHWGPARAEDIPAYLGNKRTKTEAMTLVRFPLKDRLEMVTVVSVFYALMILLPVLIFWRHNFWPIAASLFGLSYFYAIFQPWIPGRDGLLKSIPLSLLSLGGLFLYTNLIQPLPPPKTFNWAVGLVALSVFTGGELQGMSPLMRGEQANWSWEAGIGVVLGLVYWLVPKLFQW